MKEVIRYIRVGTSIVLHKKLVSSMCHYVARSAKPLSETTIRKRDERVCDECQRLEKKK